MTKFVRVRSWLLVSSHVVGVSALVEEAGEGNCDSGVPLEDLSVGR